MILVSISRLAHGSLLPHLRIARCAFSAPRTRRAILSIRCFAHFQCQLSRRLPLQSLYSRSVGSHTLDQSHDSRRPTGIVDQRGNFPLGEESVKKARSAGIATTRDHET